MFNLGRVYSEVCHCQACPIPDFVHAHSLLSIELRNDILDRCLNLANVFNKQLQGSAEGLVRIYVLGIFQLKLKEALHIEWERNALHNIMQYFHIVVVIIVVVIIIIISLLSMLHYRIQGESRS